MIALPKQYRVDGFKRGHALEHGPSICCSACHGVKFAIAGHIITRSAAYFSTTVIRIDDTLISEEVFDRKFVCDLSACKGACCVEGESGAPLEEHELSLIEKAAKASMDYLPQAAKDRLEITGFHEKDEDGDLVTPLMGEGKECVYTVFDKNKVAKCGLELAWLDGKSDWQKPVSCHLYPLRLAQLKDFVAVNMHKWHICEPACECGAKLDVPVYKFLKAGLVRRFGEDWFQQMELADKLRQG